MLKKSFILSIISLLFLLNTSIVWADTKGAGDICKPGIDTCTPPNYSCLQYDSKTYLCLSRILGAGDECNIGNPGTVCVSGYDCQFDIDLKKHLCQKSTVVSFFGKIQPPAVLRNLLEKDPTGAGAISVFLSNFITLIYSIAAIVLLFMIIWGAFEWLTSGGDKEKVASAQRRIISAIIGIILFAAAFAIISVLGAFTGFRFFKGQGITPLRDIYGNINGYRCPNGDSVFYIIDPEAACKGHGT